MPIETVRRMPDLLDILWDPLVQEGSTWCAANVQTHAGWLPVGSERWPVALTTPVVRNSYVVSMIGHFLDYGAEERRRLESPVLRGSVRAMVAALRPLLLQLEPVLVLDALPLSTVLRPTHSRETWAMAFAAARMHAPGVPTVVRSVDESHNRETMAIFQELGLRRVVSRLVFHQDPRDPVFWRARNLQHDLAMIRERPLPWRPLIADDALDVAHLYWQLYGQKHSTLNPEYSANWIEHAVAHGALFGEALEIDGRMAACYLSYRVNDAMTNPIFGYDLRLPIDLGLYRRLSVRVLEVARDLGCRLHASSGAPAFKQTRGGVPALESFYVDLGGVHGGQRTAWLALSALSRVIGPRILRLAR
jgi:hypothetical protein